MTPVSRVIVMEFNELSPVLMEKFMLVCMALMALAFVVSVVVAKPDWWRAIEGVIPTMPPGSMTVVIALIGTCLSANAAFFSSYGTQERKRTEAEYRDITAVDTIPGIVAPGIMTALVILVAAKVFNGPLGPEGMVSTISGLAKVFEPVAGPVGNWIFSLGYFAAAFSAIRGRSRSTCPRPNAFATADRSRVCTGGSFSIIWLRCSRLNASNRPAGSRSRQNLPSRRSRSTASTAAWSPPVTTRSAPVRMRAAWSAAAS